MTEETKIQGRIGAAIRIHVFAEWNPRNSWAVADCGTEGRGRLVLGSDRRGVKCPECWENYKGLAN